LQSGTIALDSYYNRSLDNPSIAIVLNTGSLLENNFGHIIDQFDYVVRFNAFRIANFEKYVGTKTTHIALNSVYYKKYQDSNYTCLLTTSPTNKHITPPCERFIDVEYLYRKPCTKILFMDVTSKGLTGKRWCTSGLQVTFWALHPSQNARNVSVFGLSQSTNNRYHYFDKMSLNQTLRDHKEHSYYTERKVYEYLQTKNTHLFTF
jgi:hypothetical protein